MAYSKRTWKGRQGTGLNKFSINGASPVTVVNQPDSITEVGDALSAGNLNDLETRIDNAFNAVDAEVATKADETEVTNLKNALQATNKRVTNLEQKAGDEIVVNYPDSTYGMDEVPANVAKYAKVTKLRGVSRVENQLVNGLYVRPETYGLMREATADGGIRIYGTCTLSTSFTVATMPSVTSGHSYLTSLGATLPAGCRISTSSDDKASSAVSTLSAATSFGIDVTSGMTIDITMYPVARDLTLYFGGSIPSNAQTVADIQKNYPELLIPSDYDTGTRVDTTYSAVESVGFNRLDNTTFVKGRVDNGVIGYASGTTSMTITETGVSFTVSTSYRGVASGLIEVEPVSEYYFKFRASNVQIRFDEYDANENWIRLVYYDTTGSGVFTTDINCAFIRISFQYTQASGTADVQDINFNISQPSTSVSPRNGDYVPFSKNTLILPSPVTLRSAGSVADTDELNVEVDGVERRRQTTRVGSITVSGSSVGLQTDAYTNIDYYFVNKPSNYKYNNTSSADGLMIQNYPKILNYPVGGAYDTTANVGVAFTGFIYARLVFGFAKGTTLEQAQSALNGLTINYELAEESVTLSDPILDPFLKVEGGGTIRPIQTQTTEIDSAMTAEYLSLGA